MTCAQAAEQLLAVEAARGEGVCGPATRAVGLARLGQSSQVIISGSLAELAGLDLGPPLHSLILPAPGPLHELEEACLAAASWEPARPASGGAPGGHEGGAGRAGVRTLPRARHWEAAAMGEAEGRSNREESEGET